MPDPSLTTYQLIADHTEDPEEQRALCQTLVDIEDADFCSWMLWLAYQGIPEDLF